MKIALLTDGLFPNLIGGVQKHSHLLIKYLSKNKIYVDVFYVKNDLSNSKLKLKDYNLKYLNFFEFKMPSTFYFPGQYVYNSYRLSKVYYRKLELNSYDFIYAQGITPWYLLKKQPRKNNLISNLHGLNPYQVSANKAEALKQEIQTATDPANPLNSALQFGSLPLAQHQALQARLAPLAKRLTELKAEIKEELE